MNTPEDTRQVERELSRSLHDRVDHLADTPLSLADVRGRARGITRRRRLATAGGIAAAAAVVVPTLLLAVPGADRADVGPAAPTPDSPTPTAQQTPADARAGGEGLDVADLPQGEPPAVGYLDVTGDPTIVQPGGERIELDVPGEVHGVAVMADGSFVAVAGGSPGDRVVTVDAQGRWRNAFPRTGGVVLSTERTQVSFTSPDGMVQVLSASSTEPRPLGELPEGSSLVSMSGECIWDMEPGTTGGCIVTADVPQTDGPPVGWVLSSAGADGPVHSGSGPDDPAVTSVADFTTIGELNTEDYGEMVAGITEVRTDGTCSGVYGPTPQRVTDWLVETCDHRFGAFSPSASRILAWESYGDGIGHGQIGMYDVTTGALLWDRVSSAPGMAFVHSAVWEDDEHLLAPAHQDGTWYLVRFGPGGEMELAAEPVDADETQPPYVPAIQP